MSNGVTSGSDPANEVEIDIATIRWIILDRLMEHGLDFKEERRKRARHPSHPDLLAGGAIAH